MTPEQSAPKIAATFSLVARRSAAATAALESVQVLSARTGSIARPLRKIQDSETSEKASSADAAISGESDSIGPVKPSKTPIRTGSSAVALIAPVDSAATLDFPGFVADLEAVADACGLRRFPIIGHSQGCPIAIEYAARHPERVSGLILIGGFARGWKFPEWGDASKTIGAISTLTGHGWEMDDPAFRRIFSQIFMPSAAPEEIEWLDGFMRHAVSARNVAGLLDAMGDVDVARHLPNIAVPVLVLHSERDMNVPISLGRELAARIPDVRFASLNSANHVLKSDEPAWQIMMDEIVEFVGTLRQ